MMSWLFYNIPCVLADQVWLENCSCHYIFVQPIDWSGDLKEVHVKSEEEDLDEKGTNDDKGIKEEPVEKSTDAEFIAKKTEEEASRGEYKEISAHPDFLCIAQFIGTFGSLLGIPNFFIDTIEDGLNSSTSQIDEDSYLNGKALGLCSSLIHDKYWDCFFHYNFYHNSISDF